MESYIILCPVVSPVRIERTHAESALLGIPYQVCTRLYIRKAWAGTNSPGLHNRVIVDPLFCRNGVRHAEKLGSSQIDEAICITICIQLRLNKIVVGSPVDCYQAVGADNQVKNADTIGYRTVRVLINDVSIF